MKEKKQHFLNYIKALKHNLVISILAEKNYCLGMHNYVKTKSFLQVFSTNFLSLRRATCDSIQLQIIVPVFEVSN